LITFLIAGPESAFLMTRDCFLGNGTERTCSLFTDKVTRCDTPCEGNLCNSFAPEVCPRSHGK